MRIASNLESYLSWTRVDREASISARPRRLTCHDCCRAAKSFDFGRRLLTLIIKESICTLTHDISTVNGTDIVLTGNQLDNAVLTVRFPGWLKWTCARTSRTKH